MSGIKVRSPVRSIAEITREWISSEISSGHDIVFVTSQLSEICMFFCIIVADRFLVFLRD